MRPHGGARLPALLVGLAAVACGPSDSPGPQPPAPAEEEEPPAEEPVALPEAVEAIIDGEPFHHIHWGILAVDAADGDVLFSRNAHRRFIPASNMKIPVTAVALAVLGEDHRWETALYGGGEIRDGVLEGPLLLPGTGDPTLGPPFHDSGSAALEALADSLAAAGVERVRGPLVVDASAWDSTSVPGTWMVGNLGPTYGATGGAFTVGAGEVEVRVDGRGEPGERARAEWSPMGHEGFVLSQAVIAEEDDGGTRLRTAYEPETRRLVVRGTVAPGEEATVRVSIRDPVRQSGRALYHTLGDAGVVVEGGLRFRWDRGEPAAPGCRTGAIPQCSSVEKLAALRSPPLSEVAAAILRPSQNWMTEQLARSLGHLEGEEGSWSEGFAVMEGYLEEEVGVAPGDVTFADGSGLSAYNLLSPEAVVRVLDHMADSPAGDAFVRAMPEPGMQRSTLSSRLTDLEGRLHAKTGTIRHVNGLSGYLERDDGTEVLFSILTNGTGMPAGPVREAMDEVVRALAAAPLVP